jgi:hypothetical protein
MRNTSRFSHRQRGSLLIVTMLLCAVIGISIGSYLQMSRTALNISNRAMYNNAAVNLAEEGIEEAMYAVNQYVVTPTYPFTGWTIEGNHAKREWTGLKLSQNATASYRVYIYNYQGHTAPKVVSRARVQLGSGGTAIEKWIEVSLLQTSKFANGLVAKNSIVFNGNNATVDSWNSEWNTTVTPAVARTPPVAYSTTYRDDNGSVGSISISSSAVLVKNADVWGYVSSNSGSEDDPPEEFVGSNGSILGSDSPSGSNVDPARTSTTFSASFKDVDLPLTNASPVMGNLGNINGNVTLPLPTDLALGPNGKTGSEWEGYYVYDASQINIGANEKLTVNGKVALRLSSSVSVGGGNGEIKIDAAGYLSLYTAATVTIAGQGVTNGVDVDSPLDGVQADELGQAKKFQLYGTKTSGTQDITITGSSQWSGVIYAPYGNVQLTGNGAVCGSVVAKDITLSGNAQFHYDEALASLGGTSPFRIAKWKELTAAADRSAYATVIGW